MVDAVWSPDGRRLAWVEAGAVLVRDLASGHVAVLAPSGAAGSARFSWSPDGRHLLFGGTAGDLWLARADATAATVRVADAVAWAPLGPTWSPDGLRFAVAVRDPDGGTRLVVAELPGG
jgi:Tol biopolymer transport system component